MILVYKQCSYCDSNSMVSGEKMYIPDDMLNTSFKCPICNKGSVGYKSTGNSVLEAIEMLFSSTKKPKKIRINGDWLRNQVNIGMIRNEEYREGEPSFFCGIVAEITSSVDTYEFVYEEDWNVR